MTSIQQRAELQRRIWQIANEVRGAVDGWDFKQYVLGTLFYRFISENFASYIEAGDESIDYAALPDSVITADIKDDAIKTKGYFIYPSQLFANVAAGANTNSSLNTDLAATFVAIEASANGYPSESDIKGLFADFDTTSNKLGNTVKDKNSRLAAVLKGVADLNFGNFGAIDIDLFGDAYEFLISNYAANAGKSGGEFFTPQHVSKLIAMLAMHKQTTVNKIYDPACGSGSLLLQAKKHFDAHLIEDGFYGQELNHTTYNLARMNMFLHSVNYDKFNIQLGDTLEDPHFADDRPFDAIVSNPPYSVKWIGSDDPTLINDERFAPAGVLAPKSKADFAFVLHALNYLSAKGRAAIVCFPGIFYRGGAEQKIRQYLVDNNYVETVISLAPNLFFGTTIGVNILVLSKHKPDTQTQFVDASGLFKKETNNNILNDEHIAQIMQVFDSKADVEHFAQSVSFESIAAKDYNLSVSSYVEAEDKREVVNITQLNAELKPTVARIDQLRKDIDAIVAEIEGEGPGRMSSISYFEKLLDGVEVEWKSLGQIAEIYGGLTGKNKSDFEGGNAKYVTYKNIFANLNVDFSSLESVKVSDTENQHVVKYGDVLFTGSSETADEAGMSSSVTTNFEGVVYLNSFSFGVRFNKEIPITPEFSKYLFRSKFMRSEIARTASGVTRFNVSKERFKKLKIPIPCPNNPEKSLQIQAEIVGILDAFTTLTAELTAELTARKKQYSYYRDLLFSFPKPEGVAA